MNTYKIYAIDFDTLNYGKGIALVVAENANKAFQVLKQQGRLNGYINEYLLTSAQEVGESTIVSSILVIENFARD